MRALGAGVRWDINSENIDSPDEAETFLNEMAERWTLPGEGDAVVLGALVLWWGQPVIDPHSWEAVLRVDLHTPTGRAALRWLPTGQIGAQADFTPDPRPMQLLESSYQPPIEVPGHLARVTATTAVRAVREFVRTGQRPTCVLWGD